MNSSSLYEHDFYAWTQRHAQLLREGKLAEVDTDHLIEEVESMGASERNQLQSRLRVLLAICSNGSISPIFARAVGRRRSKSSA